MASERGAGERLLIRRISANETRPLRHRVLRPTEGFEHTVYPRDELDDTVHLGAFDGERLVGIASLYREPRAGGSPNGWRLRGMATDPDVRGQGFGNALLAGCLDHVLARGGQELWCNARLAAVDFYRRAGFDVASEEFDIPDIGTHVVMARTVSA